MRNRPRSPDSFDEEALARKLSASTRRVEGRYFTPLPLVETVLRELAPLVPPGRPLVVVDPACGAGAFLASASQVFPSARRYGLELDPEVASFCKARVPDATVVRADALRGGLESLFGSLPAEAFELWVGNPPYNGTSALLQDAATYRRLRHELATPLALQKGTSLRDDFAFFLLLCAQRLTRKPGLLAFITPSTLLDSYFYAPLRRHLLETLELCRVLDLGDGVFQDTRVRTCVTLWRSTLERERAPASRPLFSARPGVGKAPFSPAQLEPPLPFAPASPEWLLRPVPEAARRCDERWRADGEPLDRLIPVSFPGLKTRFDELLTAPTEEALWDKVTDFLRVRNPEALAAFMARYQLEERLRPKLVALQAQLPPGHKPVRSAVRRFFRYAGARHAEGIPEEDRAYCYVERALIPRGDHRLRGAYDPHLGALKLIFNLRELPLSALLLEEEGCVHDYRHARFAPLLVPQRVRDEGLNATRAKETLGPLVPNLSPWGETWARRLGGPREVFLRVARFIRSPRVQELWAPTFGASRVLAIPPEAFTSEEPRKP